MATRARSRRQPAAAPVSEPIAFPPVRIVSGPAFEVIAELSAFTSGPARASLESGKGWIREVRALAGPELIRRVERWALTQYGELTSIAIQANPFTPGALVACVRGLAPDVLQRRLLGADSAVSRSMVSDGAFDRAIAGDAAARAELRRALVMYPQAGRALDRLLATPAASVQAELAAIVEDWAARVSAAFADRAAELVARDVEPKAGLLRVTAAKDALRVFTNGVELDPGWATEIVVVPTVAMRPFIVPVESGTTLIVLCSVANESFDDDPAVPPRRLVNAVAALGDELRLRMLHELATGALTAKQLAARLGVDRTSLHHHLGILRSAGLVSVRAEGVLSWRYALRPDGLARANAALDEYLRLPAADGRVSANGIPGWPTPTGLR